MTDDLNNPASNAPVPGSACAASGTPGSVSAPAPPGSGSLADNLRRATATINTPPYEMYKDNPWLGHLAAMMDMAALELDRQRGEIERLEAEKRELMNHAAEYARAEVKFDGDTVQMAMSHEAWQRLTDNTPKPLLDRFYAEDRDDTGELG